MLKVGITGGIGSGKSVIAKIFASLGIPVYNADTEARQLLNTNKEVQQQIIARFGEDSYKEGRLNNSYISSVVFNDPEKLEILNAITHPAIIAHGERWVQQQTTSYTVKEAALFFESGSASSIDFMIGVYTPENIRVTRVQLRDGLTPEKIKQRIRNQLDESIKMKLCDAIIDNSGTLLVTPQVITLHEKFLKMAAQQ